MGKENMNKDGAQWEALVAIHKEGSIRYVEAKDKGSTEWYVIAAVDMQTGHVFYSSLEARMEDSVQMLINGLADKAKEGHPYSVERMEILLSRVVDYECKETANGEGIIQAKNNLSVMGFTEEEMSFFGFPEET